MQTDPRKPRRTANACIPCRQSKIKCSGEEPCANCQRRIIKCRFADGGHRVMVSERYLQELQKQAHDQRTSPEFPSPSRSLPSRQKEATASSSGTPSNNHLTNARPASSSDNLQPDYAVGQGFSIYTSPFVGPSTTITNTHNNRRSWIWLAPSSTWSFTVRLTLILTQKLSSSASSSPSPPSYFGSDTYPLSWTPHPPSLPPDISSLPSIDHALHLFYTVKFHLSHHYRFFDDGAFATQIHEFYYGNAQQKAADSPLWFAQFLIVLAFGQAFTQKSKDPKMAPGWRYFTRAMALIPDLASLWKDSLLAIEVLALAGLYLYSVDHRETAHVYVGQALRIAQLEGLHTQLPEGELGPGVVARCRNLWWTIYIMDRHFSSSLGLPMSTADSDITTLRNPSSTGSQEDTILCLQAKLWHLLSVILNTIYKTEKTELETFLGTTRSILHTMAGHAQEIENIISVKFQNSVDTMSKGTRHITLLYHQCVIVATRPLLLSVLRERLDKLGHGDENWETFFSLTTTLISTGIKSAVKTLQILSLEDTVLDVFLPFDLEFIYAAVLHLTMSSTLFPSSIPEDQRAAQAQAHSCLDEMVSKGNKVAEVRKAELAHLESLCRELALHSEQRGLQTLTLDDFGGAEILEMATSEANMADVPPHDPRVVAPDMRAAAEIAVCGMGQGSLPAFDNQMSNVEFLDNIGISSGDFFDIVDQMGDQDIMPNQIFDTQFH